VIVAIVSLLVLGIWTWICWSELRRLQREHHVASRSWTGDLWAAARNRRAVVIVAMWVSVLGYTVGSVNYLDVNWLDWSRLFATTVRIALLAAGLWIVLGRR
jgi:hypothetical protein